MTLDEDALEEMLSERTRVVAFTLGSNAVGSIPDAARIAAAAHRVGALAWADGVHLAPHRRLRRADWGLDVLLCSPYKYFGPHLGVAAIRRDLAESLPADRVRPADEDPPGHRFETGTQSHEAVAGATAAIGYLRSLGEGDLDLAFARITEHETALAERFLAGLPDGVELYGIPSAENRTPTFCFNVAGLGPAGGGRAAGRARPLRLGRALLRAGAHARPGPGARRRGAGRLPALHERGGGRPAAGGAGRPQRSARVLTERSQARRISALPGWITRQ